MPDISGFYYSPSTGFGYDYSWLSQTVLFGAHQWLGGAGIAIVTSVVAGFTFFFLYKLLERNCTNMLVNLTVLGLALATVTAYLSGRPAMFTVAFFTLEVFVLSGFIRSRGSFIWLIPPMTALWANLHPGFAVAPLVILLFIPLGREARDRWTLAACLAATVIAVVFSPHGWRMYLMPVEMAQSASLLRGLSEWKSVSGWETVLWGGLVALVTCGLSLRRQPFPVTLLVASTAIAAGVSCRNMPLFGVAAAFALGRTLLPALAPVFGRSGLIRKFDVKFEGAGGWVWAVAVPLLIAGSVRLGISPMDLDFDYSGYPTAAVRHIEDNHCPDNLFTRETWSGYLLWKMPERKLFYDAKGSFSREAAEAHSELVKPKAGWRGAADRYNLSTLLLERGSPLAVVLSEATGWRREYSDSLSEVFVRTTYAREEAAAPLPSPSSSMEH